MLVAALVLAVLGLAYRALVVAPARSARVQTADVAQSVEPLLLSLGLPLSAVPGFGPPAEGDPVAGLALDAAAEETLRGASERLSGASDAAPSEAAPYALQGAVRLALNDERGARMAWEQVLAHGSKEEAADARVGIAAVQIRSGLRSADEQDRLFALEVALHTLAPVTREYAAWPHRLVQEAVVHLAMGREEAVDGVLVELANVGGPIAGAGLPLLAARRSGEESVSTTLDGLLDRPAAPE